MDEKEKNVKKAIISTTNAIKRKYKTLHDETLQNEIAFKDHFAPITTPLTQLINEVKKKKTLEPHNMFLESGNKKSVNASVSNDEESSYSTDATEYYDTPTAEKLKIKLKRDHVSPRQLNYDDDSSNNNEPTTSIQQENHISNINRKIQNYLSNLTPKSKDVVYGIRREGDSFKMGSEIVHILEDGLKVRNNDFRYSKGLFDLIFCKKPQIGYTSQDLTQYKKMLELTNSHRKNFEPNGPFKGNGGYKYMNIIKPLIQKKGAGIESEYMEVLNRKIDYRYWDDPNELVERLRLLLLSKSAGHTGHDNEILSIIEELREAKIIE